MFDVFIICFCFFFSRVELYTVLMVFPTKNHVQNPDQKSGQKPGQKYKGVGPPTDYPSSSRPPGLQYTTIPRNLLRFYLAFLIYFCFAIRDLLCGHARDFLRGHGRDVSFGHTRDIFRGQAKNLLRGPRREFSCCRACLGWPR